jgi:hypothetical protein
VEHSFCFVHINTSTLFYACALLCAYQHINTSTVFLAFTVSDGFCSHAVARLLVGRQARHVALSSPSSFLNTSCGLNNNGFFVDGVASRLAC